MAKLKTFSGIEICKIPERYGFHNIRQRGSHIIMQKKTGTSSVTVPVPNHKEIKIGTLRSIIRQSGINKEVFES